MVSSSQSARHTALQDGAVRLTLDPSSDDGRLFRRRFSDELQGKLRSQIALR